jgi:hypothetical protein
MVVNNGQWTQRQDTRAHIGHRDVVLWDDAISQGLLCGVFTSSRFVQSQKLPSGYTRILINQKQNEFFIPEYNKGLNWGLTIL